MQSGGRYFTIQDQNSSNTFINGIIVNGLTKNDNSQGDDTTLLAGLDASHFINGSQTQTMSYTARNKEQLDFSIQSLNAGSLTAQAVLGGKVLAKTQYPSTSDFFSVVAPSAGQIDIKVTAKGADADSIFIVGVTSNLPPENCTVGIGTPRTKTGSSSHAKIFGPTFSLLGLLALLSLTYWLYKHYYSKISKTSGPATTGDSVTKFAEVEKVSTMPWFAFPPHPPKQPRKKDNNDSSNTDEDSGAEDSGSDDSCSDSTGDQNGSSQPGNTNQSSDPSKYRIRKVKTYGNNHHHHLHLQHPCFDEKCPIVSHVCEDAEHRCTCVDPKCKLNSRGHKCKDENALHTCAGPENDPTCPLNDPEYAKIKKQEHDSLVKKYMAQDFAKKGLKMAAKHAVNAATGGLPV
jgi:hypothetical protein